MNPRPRRFDHTTLEILDGPECRRLLSTVPIGRLVFTQGGLPAVRVVNFVVDQDSVVFATSGGDKYRAAQRGDVVAFEADDVDHYRHLGWTVTAVGHLSIVDPADAAKVRHRLPLRPWAPGDHPHLIRLGIEAVDGRRLLAWGERPHNQASGTDGL